MGDIRNITAIGTEYDTELNEAVIKIGGTTEKFVPNINASKWNDEAWLNINMPDVVTNEIETFQNDKIELTVGNRTHRYYELDGKIEYEMEFSKRPIGNTVVFNLTFPKGLRFSYQDTLYNDWLAEQEANPHNPNNLTWEQYQEAAHRPDNVVGSYAVYWAKKNNKYKTGKFCHIYRPKVIDADGREMWAELNITGNVMTITIDGKWLDDARYPVTLDPTLGYDSGGGSNWGYNNIKDTIWDVTDGSGGAINTYYCRLESVAANTDVKMGVYECSQVDYDPEDGDLLEQALMANVEVGVNEVAGSSTNLSANTYYNIAFIPENSSNDVYYDSDGNCGYYTSGRTYADELSNPYPGSTTIHNRHYSLWVDYGGAAPPTGIVQQATAYAMKRKKEQDGEHIPGLI